MALISKFLTQLAIWTGLLLLAFTALSALGGWTEAIAHLPAWAGRALGLAAFPAGLAVSRDVLPDGLPSRSVLGTMLGLTVGLSVTTFALANWVGPAAQRSIGQDVGLNGVEAATMSYGTLRREVVSAIDVAEQRAEVSTIEHWLPANALLWQHDMRTLGSVLPFLFGWIGVLVGFWTRLTPRADLRQAQHWALGLFLVMSTYLAGENSYELIVLNAAGPAFFAGLFVLFIPTMLVFGLGWPTALVLWDRSQGNTTS